ncbi:MAG TPA: TonB family protein, partial [Thermoanaerobaculia bacterium]
AKADAQRLGGSDIITKPYTEAGLLAKVQELMVIPTAPAKTSSQNAGDLLDEMKPARRTAASKASDEVDKMLADTLGGMMPQRKRETAPVQPPAKAKTTSELDRKLQDTLSGIEKSARRTTGGGTPRPPVPSQVPGDDDPEAVTTRLPLPGSAARTEPQPVQERSASQPIFRSRTAAASDLVKLAPEVEATKPDAGAPKVEDDDTPEANRFGQYVLVDKIAAGGMAEVWKARMRGVEGFQKIVAIKKILPHLSDNQDFIEMFIDEAKLAAQLNHNNITHIYDLGRIQNSYYIAMEYIDGFDLKTILRRAEDRNQPLTPELALFIASKVASALDYAHRKKDFEEQEMGLVHRDVSPQNVLISQEGDIKLCDFGIAKAASKASHTQAGALKGKLQYMSPEQAWGRTIDRRSDVFALATVLFEMLTGRKLFTGENEMSILEQVREARVTAPSLYNDEVTPEIDSVVLKALQKDPDNRYQTAGEMARDLDAILYEFRPTPTSADLAIFMHRLTAAEAIPEPVNEPATQSVAAIETPMALPSPFATPSFELQAPVIAAPASPPVAVSAVRVEPAVVESPAAEPEKKKPVALMAAAAAVLLLAGGGAAAWMMTRNSPAPAATTTTQAAVVPAVPLAVPAAAPAVETGGLSEAIDTAEAATTTIDPSLVDREVQKLLAAERSRLEAQNRAQGQPPARAPQVAEAAQPAVQQSETRPPAPAPVVQEAPAVQQPVPEPAAPQQTAPAVAQAPAQQPAAARAREGELVPVGAEGLTAPRVLRRGAVSYPPVARMQKVEGTVITSVLVSETGQVIEVRILRGVNRPVGLNEAAEQAMRRSTFAPGTKDGVRVKSWVTVPVEFKL